MKCFYRMYYSKVFKNKWYFKFVKQEVNLFISIYRIFKEKIKQDDINLISQRLEQYCKPLNPKINMKLRSNITLSYEDNELKNLLDDLIGRFRLKENIIVYRGSNINIFETGNDIIDKGYISTSLVKESIDFCHAEKNIYKIYIPKGSFGFCPQVFTCREIEYEYILPRESKFQLIKKKQKKAYTEIICKLII